MKLDGSEICLFDLLGQDFEQGQCHVVSFPFPCPKKTVSLLNIHCFRFFAMFFFPKGDRSMKWLRPSVQKYDFDIGGDYLATRTCSAFMSDSHRSS